MMIECGLRTSQKYIVNEQMRELKKKVKNFKHPPDITDLKELITYYEEKQQYTRAMAVTLCVYHLSILQGYDSSDLAKSAYRLMKEMVIEGEHSSQIVADQGVPLMQDTLKVIRTSKTMKPMIKTENEALCLSLIGSIHNYVGDYQSAIQRSEECLRVLDKHKVNEGFIAGRTYCNIGFANENKGNLTLAKVNYTKALGIKEKAEDFEDEKSKQKSIESTRERLEALNFEGKCLSLISM